VQTHRSFANTTALYGQGVLGVRPNDITISVPKLFFGYATGSNVFFPFSVGASCVLFAERSTPAVLFDQIRRHRPTILINVPTMVQQMLGHAEAAHADLTSLRLATSAGEALPAELHQRWMNAFGVELLDGLGTAEMWHIFLTNRPGGVVAGTLGRAVPGFEIRLCDADGHDVPDGEVGALWVKGDSRAIGYWQQMDDTIRAFRGEWYVSGDMLRRNPDGTFVYCGRSDDMLKVSGKWLAPGELENCLISHRAVREVAVVGVRNADGLVKPCAFVVADEPSPALAAELQEYTKAKLEPYKYPRDVIFLDTLPRTHLGKVDRAALARSRET
jgi:benzoate-CoA ligase family protein